MSGFHCAYGANVLLQSNELIRLSRLRNKAELSQTSNFSWLAEARSDLFKAGITGVLVTWTQE